MLHKLFLTLDASLEISLALCWECFWPLSLSVSHFVWMGVDFPRIYTFPRGSISSLAVNVSTFPVATGLTQMVRTSSHTCQWYFTSQCWLARERTQSNTYFITQLTVLKLLCQISSWIHIYQWVIKLYWAHYCLKCQSWVVLLERWKHLDGYNSILEPRWTHTWICLRFVLHVCNSR